MSISVSRLIQLLSKEPDSEKAAFWQARWASLILVICAVASAVRYWMTRPSRAETIEQMRDLRGPVTMAEAGVDQMLFDRVSDLVRVLGAGVNTVAVMTLLGMAIWQWKRPGKFVPLIYLVSTLLGALFVMMAMMQPAYRTTLLTPTNVAAWTLNLVLALFMYAAYRGANYLSKPQ